MQHPDFNQQLAGERQSRYRAEAARSRLTRPDRRGDGRASRSASVQRPADPTNESNSALHVPTRASIWAADARFDAHVDAEFQRLTADWC